MSELRQSGNPVTDLLVKIQDYMENTEFVSEERIEGFRKEVLALKSSDYDFGLSNLDNEVANLTKILNSCKGKTS